MNIYHCSLCGKKFERYKSQVRNENRVFCSIECKNDYFSLNKLYNGNKNSNYKNGNRCEISYCECGNIKDYRSKKCSECSKRGYSINKKEFTIEKIKETAKKSSTIIEFAHELNVARATIYSIIKKYNIDISHFVKSTKKISDEEIFCENSKYIGDIAKRRIIKNKLLDHTVCGICGQKNIWNGKELTMELHHKVHRRDHRIENVIFVCPNCHSQQ